MHLFLRAGGIFSASLALAGLTALAATPVQAQNLVQDGGFESADLGSGAGTDGFTAGNTFDLNWAITGNVGIDTDNIYIFDGDKSLFLNDGLGFDAISQNLSTVAGQEYTLSFYANSELNTPLTVTFGDLDVNGGPIVTPANGFNGPPPGNDGVFTFYSFTVTAASAFTGLSFSTTGSTAAPNLKSAEFTDTTLELDDIRVEAVPEAATAVSFGLLLALGLGGLALASKKRNALVSA